MLPSVLLHVVKPPGPIHFLLGLLPNLESVTATSLMLDKYDRILASSAHLQHSVTAQAATVTILE